MLRLVFILTILLSSDARAASWDKDRAADYLLHQESLMTIAGAKPMSLFKVSDSRDEFLARVGELQAGGELSRDLGWFATQGNGVVIYRKSLLAELVHDRKAMAFLEPFGFSGADEIGVTIAKLKSSWTSIPQPMLSAVHGVFFGYPHSEILEFGQRMQQKKDFSDGRTVVLYENEKEFNLGRYTSFTEKSAKDEAVLKAQAKAAVQAYREARKRGLSPSKILSSMTPDICGVESPTAELQKLLNETKPK